MEFSNREIASYIWIAIFLGLIVCHPDTRRGLPRVLQAFLHPLILKVLAVAAIYIALWVFVFARLGLWTTSNFKTTAIWTISFAFATMLDINRITSDKKFFKKITLEAVSITGFLVFIMELHSFNLLIEIITIPILAFLTAIHVFAKNPSQYRVRNLASNLIGTIGLFYLIYSIYRTAVDIDHLNTLATAREFGVPIFLTLCFIPFLYFLIIYCRYEEIFSGLINPIPDPKLRRRAKLRCIFAFGKNTDLAQRWSDSVYRFKPKDSGAIVYSIKRLKELVQREKNPPPVSPDAGWSPYLAMEFLKPHGLRPSPYTNIYDETWFSNSPALEFGNGHGLKNSLSYQINGTEHFADELTVTLNISVPNESQIAEEAFAEAAIKLASEALGQASDKFMLDILSKEEKTELVLGRKIVSLEMEMWRNLPGGYSRSVSVKMTSPDALPKN